MLYRFLTLTSLLLGLPLLGCDKTSLGNPSASATQEKNSDRDKSDKDVKDVMATKNVADQPQEVKKTKPADAGKITPLKDSLKKYRFRWSDEKESDFPLIIEMKAPPIPEEIKGPFPENAEWRTKEKTPEKKMGKSNRP
jgi:hypothetical protein